MNEALPHRMAAMAGLALAATTAVWWLGSTRLTLDHGTDAAGASADALRALWLVRSMALALLSVRVGALRGSRQAVATGLGLIGPSWPLVVVAWSASDMPLTRIVLGEALLLAASVALPLIGIGLRRWLRQPEPAAMTGTAVGVALAASVWVARDFWI
jgi:hypothetical protein